MNLPLLIAQETVEAADKEPSMFAPIAFAAGCALLTMILLRRSYRYFGKRRRGSGKPIDAQPRPTDPWAGAKKDAAARFDREQVELHELARELMGQLESKTIVLNELVMQSQRQIERLEELLEKVAADERG